MYGSQPSEGTDEKTTTEAKEEEKEDKKDGQEKVRRGRSG